MKNRRFLTRLVVLLSITVALGYTFYTTFADQKDIVSVGEVAPNFVLKDMEGNEVELHDLRGKGVFLNFWATVCPPCVYEMPYMENNFQKYKDQGIEVIAVNFDEQPIRIERFVERLNLTFPILLDPGLQVSQLYGVRELPATFLIDEDGIVIERRVGALSEQMVEDYVQRIVPSQ
ncbi:thiol-disulfide oxidoreductase [Anaerobacillus arseniciselenatis]|uniref:Thiol-disulfide oxidoreductase n=1 Tax=Anaerobacillus arseniciselenatis TaxID=85682 RepID=A0A1S2LU80_9BACI|nr:thiol-disulfide oxidoreductase ResA [Anaerobacillus arseniciselenatis]OIJ15906.1 thiol-disulfide oxidoreductase [Anaerobacillus arseniciselenatis]